MPFNCIKTETRGRVGLITLDRPKALNAINEEMRQLIIEYCARAEADRNVQVVLFRGAGEKGFTVGGDIKERASRNAEPAAASASLMASWTCCDLSPWLERTRDLRNCRIWGSVLRRRT